MLASPVVKSYSAQKKLDFKEHVEDEDFSVPHLFKIIMIDPESWP